LPPWPAGVGGGVVGVGGYKLLGFYSRFHPGIRVGFHRNFAFPSIHKKNCISPRVPASDTLDPRSAARVAMPYRKFAFRRTFVRPTRTIPAEGHVS